jgi:hypothetical protein
MFCDSEQSEDFHNHKLVVDTHLLHVALERTKDKAQSTDLDWRRALEPTVHGDRDVQMAKPVLLRTEFEQLKIKGATRDEEQNQVSEEERRRHANRLGLGKHRSPQSSGVGQKRTIGLVLGLLHAIS